MTTFRLTSPPMRGAHTVQVDLNRHLKAWGVPQDALLKEDGSFGQHTYTRAHEVCFGLGINHNLYEHSLTAPAQAKIHNATRLTPVEHKHQQARAPWRKRLVHRLSGGSADHAVRFALAMAAKGITERPPGSNLGPHITQWERLAGYHVPPGVSWCGCFVNACLVAGGMHPQTWGIGFVPSIEGHAKAGLGGWHWRQAGSEPHRGWIATFGRGEGEHTEFVVANGSPLQTVGGNTSAGDGSFNEGGGVYRHNFAHYQGFPLRGFAVPPWN